MAKKKTQTEAEESNFEESMEQLEAIVRRLEQGGGALEDALTDYSTAIALLKRCHLRLEEAERKIEILSGVDAQGNPLTEPISELSASLEEKQSSRSERRSAAGSQARGPKPKNDDVTELF